MGIKSTLTQLSALAQLQVDLTELLDLRTVIPDADTLDKQTWESAKAALRDYLGSLAQGLDRAEVGKVGLALSGGGFRASLFHIGVLAYLAECDALRRVDVLSCVSGGSIIGAHYYLKLQRLLETKADAEVTREDFLDIVERIEHDFFAGVQTNIRSQVFGSIWSNLRTFVHAGSTTTTPVPGRALRTRSCTSRVKDEAGLPTAASSATFFVRPQGRGLHLQAQVRQLAARAKVPMLVLNATTLNTGHNWQFTASWMGEPPISLDAESKATTGSAACTTMKRRA